MNQQQAKQLLEDTRSAMSWRSSWVSIEADAKLARLLSRSRPPAGLELVSAQAGGQRRARYGCNYDR
jgi:hypothetical protein